MGDRDDHDELLRSRERLHQLEGSVSALVFRVQNMNDMLAEIKPLLADAAYAKRRRSESLAKLAVAGRLLTMLGSAAVLFEVLWTVTH